MKGRHTHTFRPFRGFSHTVKLVWHPTRKACESAYYKKTVKKPKLDLWGFCTGKDEGKRLANIHFSPHKYSASLVAHEAVHAALHLVRRTGLRVMKNKDAEEVMAEFVENVVAAAEAEAPKNYGKEQA